MSASRNLAVSDERPDPTGHRGVWRALRLAALAVIALAALVLVGTLLASVAQHLDVSQEDLEGWQNAASAIRRWGLLVQCLVVAAIGIWWPAIVRYGLRKGVVQEHELERVLRLRARAVAFGVAYLLLVPIGPATLWQLFS